MGKKAERKLSSTLVKLQEDNKHLMAKHSPKHKVDRTVYETASQYISAIGSQRASARQLSYTPHPLRRDMTIGTQTREHGEIAKRLKNVASMTAIPNSTGVQSAIGQNSLQYSMSQPTFSNLPRAKPITQPNSPGGGHFRSIQKNPGLAIQTSGNVGNRRSSAIRAMW